MKRLLLIPLAAFVLGGCIVTPFDPTLGVPAIDPGTPVTCHTPAGFAFTTTIQTAENEGILDYCEIPH